VNVLVWRAWEPIYPFPVTFSTVELHGMGGTETQMLWHIQHLRHMGHDVQVLGASDVDVLEHDVEFVGAPDRAAQERLMDRGTVRVPDVILLEGGFAAAPALRTRYPQAKLVHVGHNVDPRSDRAAFSISRYIDVHALVGPGQFADYTTRFPGLRHKFMLLRNAVPWESIHGRVERRPVGNQIVWVGAWDKKGLRDWAETMAVVLRDRPDYRWTLCVPSHGSNTALPPYLTAGLDLPADRVAVRNLPLRAALAEMSAARVVLVSLGNETASLACLDAHAMGRPVISGNDMVYKYANPEGTGLRVHTAQERYTAAIRLIDDPALGDELGRRGQALVLSDFSEAMQCQDLQRLLGYLEIHERIKGPASFHARSRWVHRLQDRHHRARRNMLRIRARVIP